MESHEAQFQLLREGAARWGRGLPKDSGSISAKYRCRNFMSSDVNTDLTALPAVSMSHHFD